MSVCTDVRCLLCNCVSYISVFVCVFLSLFVSFICVFVFHFVVVFGLFFCLRLVYIGGLCWLLLCVSSLVISSYVSMSTLVFFPVSLCVCFTFIS